MRPRVGVVLALLVLTAGCNAFTGDGGQVEATVTPAPVPTVTATPSDPRVGVAPGVSTRAVTHPEFLAQRHAEVVRDMRYELSVSYEEDRRLGEVDAAVDRYQRLVVENETVYRRNASSIERRVRGTHRFLRGYGEYADGRALYESWIDAGGDGRVFERTADPAARPDYADLTGRAVLEYLDLESATVSRYDVPGSDADHYLVTGNRSSLLTMTTVRNYSARAVVSEDGFVRSLRVAYDGMQEDTEVSVEYGFAYSDVGTATVRPPDWADDAYEEFGVDREAETDGADAETADRPANGADRRVIDGD